MHCYFYSCISLQRFSSWWGVQKLSHSQHETFWHDILLVNWHHYDFPEIPQGCQHRAVGQIDTSFPTSITKFAIHWIYVACEANVVIHCWFAWKFWCSPTIHEHLGHSMICSHGWQRCFPFGGYYIPWVCKSWSRDCKLLSSRYLLWWRH